MNWVKKVTYNPFSKDEQPKEKPVILEKVRRLRLLNNLQLEDIYIGELLGNLEKGGHKFKESGGWGNWPDDYLAAMLTFALTKLEVMSERIWEKEYKPDTSSLDKAAGPIDIQAARARTKANYQNISKLPADFLGLKRNKTN